MEYVSNATPGAALNFFGAGLAGFQNGDPATGTQGTELDAGLMNDILGNLMNIMTVAGIAPTPARYADLSDAIAAIAAQRKIQFENANYAIVAADAGKTIVFETSGGALTATMPDVTTVPLGFTVELRCEGPYPLTVQRAGATAQIFDVTGQASFVLSAQQQALIFGDQVEWRSAVRRSGVYTPGFAAIANSGNLTVGPGVFTLDVELWGGGGGGDNAGDTSSGGAAGGYSRKMCTVKPGDVIACTIGAGGAAGSPASPGGTTSFGAIFSATGGGTGNVSTPSDAGGYGGGLGGDITFNGGYGGRFLADSISGAATPSMGGAAVGGGGGGWQGGGVSPGGGGGGGPGGLSGPGAPGYIIVRW